MRGRPGSVEILLPQRDLDAQGVIGRGWLGLTLVRSSRRSCNMRELIRADEKRKAEEQLEAKLLEGLNSPESALTPADRSALRKEALTKLKARRKQR